MYIYIYRERDRYVSIPTTSEVAQLLLAGATPLAEVACSNNNNTNNSNRNNNNNSNSDTNSNATNSNDNSTTQQ